MTQPECETSPSENPPKSPKWLRVSSELERTLSFLYIRQNMNLIMTSFLYWRASAAVWTGRGAFSQQCHHHSCISKASLRFLPGDKRLILKQPWLTSIRQSQEWTTSINVFLFSLLHFFISILLFVGGGGGKKWVCMVCKQSHVKPLWSQPKNNKFNLTV